jgi:hypothetical protein
MTVSDRDDSSIIAPILDDGPQNFSCKRLRPIEPAVAKPVVPPDDRDRRGDRERTILCKNNDLSKACPSSSESSMNGRSRNDARVEFHLAADLCRDRFGLGAGNAQRCNRCLPAGRASDAWLLPGCAWLIRGWVQLGQALQGGHSNAERPPCLPAGTILAVEEADSPCRRLEHVPPCGVFRS